MKLLHLLTLTTLTLASSFLFAAQTWRPKVKVYASPDGHVRAIVRPSGKLKEESRIEIQTSRGRKIFQRDFGSPDGQHGEGVVQASWTPDSRFFVWSMTSSGGHHPWNFPTYFYSRRLRSSRSLDAIVGAITEVTFSVKAPNTVTGTRLDFKNKGRNVPFSVKLGEH